MVSYKKVKFHDPEVDKGPSKIMGKGDFANMPSKSMIKEFPKEWDYRGGLRNGPTASLEMLSDIQENCTKDYQ